MNSEGFTYRYGLSFPGQITHDQTGEVINFRSLVKEVADLMKANCNNQKARVLYDHYHQGRFAREELITYLPEQYKLCELIVAFLCKDYAQKEKQWCRAEWEVIRGIARDPSQRHRVMYLWHGELDNNVLGELDISSKSAGFLHIDQKPANEIWDWIYDRYTDDRSVIPSVPAVGPPQQESNGTNECQRLLIQIEPAHVQGGSRNASRTDRKDDQFQAYTWLYQADMSRCKPPWSGAADSSSGRLFAKKDLAAQIIDWHDHQFGEAVHSPAATSSPQLLTVLVLPAEWIEGSWLPDLIGMIRKEVSRRQKTIPAQKPVPLVVACRQRLAAPAVGQGPAGSDDLRAWRAADTQAAQISRWIQESAAAASPAMASWNWLLFADVDDADADAAMPPQRRPQYFADKSERIRAAAQLKQLRIEEKSTAGSPGRFDPHALYLQFTNPKANRTRREGIRRLLRAGVPFFVLAGSDPVADGPHPFDQLLKRAHHQLIDDICRLHAITTASNPEEDALCRCVRNSIIFWEDHRVRPPSGTSDQDAASGLTNSLSLPLTA